MRQRTTVTAEIASATAREAHSPDPTTDALIKTAVPLSAEQRDLILSRLSARYGQPVQGQFEVDPSLLGGVWSRVGDELIDDSIAGKLEALREALIKSGETK